MPIPKWLRMISMFRNPFGRVRFGCSARRFRPENWTEMHELSRASFSNRWHQRWLAYRSRWCCVKKKPTCPCDWPDKIFGIVVKIVVKTKWGQPINKKNPTISNVKSLDLWSEWRESNSRPLEPHCASLENTMYNPILPRLSIVKFQMHYTILFHWMSRRFIPFVVKLWSNDPDKWPFSPS